MYDPLFLLAKCVSLCSTGIYLKLKTIFESLLLISKLTCRFQHNVSDILILTTFIGEEIS